METPATLPSNIWERTPPEAQAYIRSLEARLTAFEALEARLYILQEQVRTLEEQLHQNSRNSSRPPSSDPPQSARPKRPRSQRRRGGQAGHRGHTRTLIPVDEVNEVASEGQPSSCSSRISAPAATPNLAKGSFTPVAR